MTHVVNYERTNDEGRALTVDSYLMEGAINGDSLSDLLFRLLDELKAMHVKLFMMRPADGKNQVSMLLGSCGSERGRRALRSIIATGGGSPVFAFACRQPGRGTPPPKPEASKRGMVQIPYRSGEEQPLAARVSHGAGEAYAPPQPPGEVSSDK